MSAHTHLLLYRHCAPQVDGQLADVHESMLVGDLGVQRIHLGQSPLHKVDHGKDVGRGESGVLHVGNVHLLKGGGKKQEENVFISHYQPSTRTQDSETSDICHGHV